MYFGDADNIGLPPDRSLLPPWDKTIAPASWPHVGGVMLDSSRPRTRKRVVHNGVVVKDEVAWSGRSTYLQTETSLSDYIGTSWGLLAGRPRLAVTVVRPIGVELSGVVEGELTIDGARVPYHRLDPTSNQAEEYGPLSWVIAFHDGDAEVSVAGIETDDIPTEWARIDARPFRDARKFVLGAPDWPGGLG